MSINKFISSWSDYVQSPKLLEYLKKVLKDHKIGNSEVKYRLRYDYRKFINNGDFFDLSQDFSPNKYSSVVYGCHIKIIFSISILGRESTLERAVNVHFFPTSDNRICYFLDFELNGISSNFILTEWEESNLEDFIKMLMEPVDNIDLN